MSSKNSTFARAAAVVAGLAMVLSAAVPAGAQTVADLQAEIAALMAQLQALQGGSTSTVSVTFTRDLTVGSTGADVTALQQMLVSQGYLTMPAGTAFGYFGTLTKTAVARWQAANGVSATGYFGPISRAKVGAATGTTTGGTTTGGTTTGGTTTGSVSGTITTPGAEGSIAVTAAPVSSTSINEADKMDGIIAFNVKATGSDVAVQRVKVVLGSSTTEYNKIFQTLYVVDDAGRTLASLPMNSTNVVKESDGTYSATLSGFSSVVSKGTQRTYTVKADLYSTIDSSVLTANSGAFVVTMPVSGVRAIDGAGIDLYGPTGSFTQTVTVAKSLASSAQLTVSADAANPLAQSVIANNGSLNNQLDKLPVIVFDVKATNDDVKITDLNNITVAATGTGGATASTTYLYVGNGTSGQLLGSAAATSSTTSFNNLSYVIPKGTTATFTVAADIRNAAATATTITGSWTANTTNLVATNSVGDTVTNVSGSAQGSAQTVYSKGPQISLVGTPTITKNSAAFSGATSSALATFNVNIKAVGADVYFGTQSASSTFTFGTYVAGTKQTLSVASTTSWSVPSGVVTTGLQTGQAFKLQQGNSVTIPVSFYFEGRTTAGNQINSGATAVGLEAVNWSITGADTQTSNFMAGQTAWRTSEVIMP